MQPGELNGTGAGDSGLLDGRLGALVEVPGLAGRLVERMARREFVIGPGRDVNAARGSSEYRGGLIDAGLLAAGQRVRHFGVLKAIPTRAIRPSVVSHEQRSTFAHTGTTASRIHQT